MGHVAFVELPEGITYVGLMGQSWDDKKTTMRPWEENRRMMGIYQLAELVYNLH